MIMEATKEYKLRKLLKLLKTKKGRHTELITVYIPTGYDINNVLTQLSDEQGTASNIKSKSTRKNVTDALEKTIQHLKLFKQTPPKGLAVFCGNVSEREGNQDIQLWSVEPPEPLSVRIYRCDQAFVLEPLEDIITPKDIYGLIAVDNKEATIAYLKGSRYTIVKHLTSGYSGKHRAGGQSHRRFERLIKQQSHDFKTRIGEHANKTFLDNLENLRGIVIGGPAGTKDDFVEGDYLNHELKKKILSVEDITYTDESGIRELIDKSKKALSDVEMIRQKKKIQRFLKALITPSEPVTYGDGVDKALEMGAVETIMLSENLDDGLIEGYIEKAKNTDSEVEIVSEDFEEGYQLWNTFKGKAAILRYQID
ncbi:MAG: peptide chain release factor 1 [Candidatus Altiarchaeales archaeon ex4484_96]|nr:MAG: peptide chain release factor 1 [Candidatus Altiarchaeales archaeon ex4484_96]